MTLKAAMEPLSAIVRLKRNPKLHDLGSLHSSVGRFGFLERIAINDVTGRLLAGHGRVKVLQQMKAGGRPAPDNVEVDSDGGWLIPADHVSIPEADEEAVALALNRIGELGGWDDGPLVDVLSDLAAAGALEGTGWDADDVDAMLAAFAPPLEFPEFGADLEESDAERAHWATCPDCGRKFSLDA